MLAWQFLSSFSGQFPIYILLNTQKSEKEVDIVSFFHNGEISSNLLTQNQSAIDLRMPDSYKHPSFCLSGTLDVKINFAPFSDVGDVYVAINGEVSLRNTTVLPSA